MIIGEIHSKGDVNEDGTVNIEFTASHIPRDAAVVIRIGLQAIMKIVAEMADGHTVLRTDGDFGEQVESELNKIVRKEITDNLDS